MKLQIVVFLFLLAGQAANAALSAKVAPLIYCFQLIVIIFLKIKHVVVLMEENRSFDNMFGWYPGIFMSLVSPPLR